MRRRCLLPLLFLVGCVSAKPGLFPPSSADDAVDLIVLDNHWHTALIIPFAALPEAMQRDLDRFAGEDYVAIGWGDADFFTAEFVTTDLVPRAMFFSRGSVLSVAGVSGEPEKSYADDIYRIRGTLAGRAKLIDFVGRSFAREGGKLIDAGAGPFGVRFYKANGRYAFYRTCNNWTAGALREAGLPITPAYAGTAGNVALQLRMAGDVRRNGRPLRITPPDVKNLPHTRRGK
jgi:uncharacterized protein (TIGR02117 family)